jgi:transposase
VLARVDRVLDLSWLREEVTDCYCANDGRSGIDPEAALRLMLAGLLTGIVHDRKLIREAQVNIAIRWFVGYDLHEQLNSVTIFKFASTHGPRFLRGLCLQLADGRYPPSREDSLGDGCF